MKFKTTKKAISNGYNKVLRIGYCDLQNLLAFEDAIAYSTSQYGHACDYYNIDGVIISTGYSPIGEQVSHELIRKYDGLASEIRDSYDMTYEAKREAVNDLLRQFVGYAIA